MEQIDDQMALNQESGVDNTQDTTPVSETEATEDVIDTSENPTGESDEPTTETGEDIKKRNANQRIRELNAELKAERQSKQSLAQRLEELTGFVEPTDYNRPYTPQVEPGTEISPDQYKQDVMRTADSLINLRLKQQETIGRINLESKEALRNYPELDPDSDTFDNDVSEAVTEAVEAYVRQNPYGANVKKFVDKLMKPYKTAVTKEVGQATQNIAKQVSEAALRPTQIKSPEKKFESMTLEEMEAQLGVVQT